MQVVVFAIEGKALAVDITKVQEILRMLEVTPVPRMPEFALGVINVRGRVVPIVDIRRKLRLDPRPPGPRTCVLLVLAQDQVVGFLADEVSEVVDLPDAAMVPPESGPEWLREEMFAGVGKLPGRLLVMINPERLLSPQEMHLLEHHTSGALRAGEQGGER